MILPPLTLYIHIPWCIKKCPYCDFNSHISKNVLPENKYINHLLNDLEENIFLTTNRSIQSIFIGGGTPNLFSPENIGKLLNGIKSRIMIKKDAEITMEVNPGAIENKYFSQYQEKGINRISIGIQSFNNKNLLKIGRIHNSKEGKKAASLVKSLSLKSFNLDLMHSLPHQTLEEALKDLHQAIQLSPSHISWYQLTIEPNTFFSSHPPILPNEEINWQIFKKGHEILEKNGYKQYEISSYSKKGHKCQHNLNYWRFGDYLGIGCGAHSKLTFEDGKIIRIIKTKHPKGFMEGRYIHKKYNVILKDRPVEFFMNRFRLLEPTPIKDFLDFTGIKKKYICNSINKGINLGYLEKDVKKYWQITEKGKWFLDSLVSLFL